MTQRLDSNYFKDYRKELGFTNQDEAKKFLAAKDVLPQIDVDYISRLNYRLGEILRKVDNLVDVTLRADDIEDFISEQVESVYMKLTETDLLLRMNNLGRRREEVYFSWLRGRVFASYFSKYLATMFGVDPKSINLIGDDEVIDPEIFRKTPTADLEIISKDIEVRIEFQSGFQGINDIKQHKVLEAKRVVADTGVPTVVSHFDMFNGQVAVVLISDIPEDDINWITRQQMEGQTVFNISQNHFNWRIGEIPNLSLDDFFG